MASKKTKKRQQKPLELLDAFSLAPIIVPEFKLNATLPSGKLEYCDGKSWYPLATEAWVNSNGFGTGTVTSLTAGTGLSGGTITTSGTISIASVATAGTYSWPSSVNINAQGQVLGISAGTQPITSVVAGTGLTAQNSGGISNVGMSNTGVTAATYSWPTSLKVNAQGQLTSVTSGTQPITTITAGTGLTASTSSGTTQISLSSSGVSAAAYSWPASITVNAQGQVTSVTATGSLPINRLASYPGSSASFLRGDGTWNLPYINNLNISSSLNLASYGLITSGNVSATTASLIANNLASYNSTTITVSSPLLVSDSGGYSVSGSYGYLNSSGSVGTASSSGTYSISCSNRIKASEFDAYSSQKKKTLLGSGEEIENEVLKKFPQIPFFKYTYKDPIREGNGICYGVVAEALQAVLPDYVDVSGEDWVPNILQEASVTQHGKNYRLTVPNNIPELGSSKLRLFVKGTSVEVVIVECHPNALDVQCDQEFPEQVFVYGTYESCPSVSKQKLFEMGLVVLQNLLRRVEYLEEKA